MTARKDPVIDIGERPETGPLRRIMDVLHALFGKVTAVVDVALLLEMAGYTVTNAAAAPGTALTPTRTVIDFGDAGIDSVRLIVRAENSTAGSVTVAVYDVTASATLCSLTVTGTTPTTYTGSWTALTPSGSDSEIEVRVTGNGAMDPILYTVHLQGRTVRARS